MGAILKTLALTLFLTALGFAGFYVGQIAKRDTLSPLAEFIPIPAPQPKDDGTLRAMTPSVGPFTRSVTIEKTTGGPDGFDIRLSSDDAAEIVAGQSVAFYSLVDDRLYPVAGTVDRVDPDGDRIRVHITAPQNFLDMSPQAKARIILVESVSKRIPVTALMTDDNDNYFVWKALPDENGHHAVVHQQVSVGIIGDDYAELGPEVMNHELVIINPTSAIENGQTTDVIVTAMNAPLTSLSQQIRDRALTDQADTIRKEVAMFNEMRKNAAGPSGGGCGAGTNAQGLPAAIAADGAAGVAGAAPTGASAGCGSCSTPAVPVVPAAADGAAPATSDATAPAVPAAPVPATGGCGTCGNSTYGGSGQPTTVTQ